MAFSLTSEQQAAVDNRGGGLLVSAAAGSGKTRVLVERLLARVEGGAGHRPLPGHYLHQGRRRRAAGPHRGGAVRPAGGAPHRRPPAAAGHPGL